MVNEVDPVLCQTILLTYDEQALLKQKAQEWLCSDEEAARFILVKELLNVEA